MTFAEITLLSRRFLPLWPIVATFGRRALTLALLIGASSAAADDWQATIDEARGTTVTLHAWGGSPAINSYFSWADEQLSAVHDIDLVHVRITDTAEAVAQVLAEKTAGRVTDGSIDLIWINGENFAAMKASDLISPPFVVTLPNASLVDWQGKPTTKIDFTVPTEGMEAPFGMAHFVFFYDSDAVPEPPVDIRALGDWIDTNPGRFTYPAPPNFIGTSFLKQLLIDSVEAEEILQQPVDATDPQTVTAPVWAWLERHHPQFWRAGQSFPASGPALHQMLDDGEVDFSMAFNPAEASNLIHEEKLPASVRSFMFEGGSLANTHFLTIPFNAPNADGAKVVINFLLSPEAQARKQDPRIWGDPTVLAVDALTEEDRQRFTDLPIGVATLPPEALTPARLEPHPTWVTWLEAEWLKRFAS
ncbi:MAG: ABC transporter substrate-binding protein [Geminicoccaceae bacterium]